MSSPISIPGFEQPDTKLADRLFVNIQAMEKSGKTHFALTAPGPIAFLNFDIGLEGVVDKFVSDKQILVKTFKLPSVGQIDQAKKVWEDFKTTFRVCLNHKDLKTVIVDTATDAWELGRLAAFGKLTKVMPFMYTEINAIFTAMMKEVYQSDKNVILIHKMKQEYLNDKWTGKYERAGFTGIGYIVQCNLQAYTETVDGQLKFKVRVIDCRQNMMLTGMELEDDLLNFDVFKSLVLER